MAALNFPHENLNNGTEYSANGKTWVWDGTSWRLKHVTSGATSFVGLTDTPSSINNGKWLKADSGALIWTDAPAGNDTTYTQSAVVSGDNVNLRLTDSSTPAVNDDILVTAGANIEFENITAAGFTIKSVYSTFTDVAAGIVPASGGGTSKYLRADGSWHEVTSGGGLTDIVDDATPQLGGNLDLNSKNVIGSGNFSFSGVLTTRTDDVSNVAQTALQIGRLQNLSSFIVKSDGNVTTIGQVEATAFKKTNGTSSQFLKADGSVDTNTYITSDDNTEYTLTPVNSGDDVDIKLTPVGGSAATNQIVKVVSGTDITVEPDGTNGLKISSTASSSADTTYNIEVIDGTTVDRKGIKLSGSDNSIDSVELEGGSNVTLTRNNDVITITASGGTVSADECYSGQMSGQVMSGQGTYAEVFDGNLGTFAMPDNTLTFTPTNWTSPGDITSLRIYANRVESGGSGGGTLKVNTSITVSVATSGAAWYTVSTNNLQSIEWTKDGSTGALNANDYVIVYAVEINGTVILNNCNNYNTTYGVSAQDHGSDATKKLIRLTSVDPTGTDDVILDAGTGITISRTGDEISFASSHSIETASDVDYEGTTGTDLNDKILKYSSNKWRLVTESDTQNTYGISLLNGDSTDTEKLRLTQGGVNVWTEVTFKTGNNQISIERTGSELKYQGQVTLSNLLDTNIGTLTSSDNNKILKYNSTGGGGAGAWELADDGGGTVFVGEAAGLVPASTASVTDKFLKSDGNWVDAPAAALDAVLTAGNTSSKSIEVGNATVAALNVTANDITLNSDFTGSSPSANVSLKVERGNSADVSIRWNESTDKWQYTNDGSNFSDIGSGGSDNDTTYSQSAVGSGNNVNLRLTAGGSGSGDDDILITRGTGVSFTNISAAGFTINSGVTVQDEDSSLTTTATTLNFKGTGVTASGTGATKTITIPGGGGVTVKDEGTSLSTTATSIDFRGELVAATSGTADKTVTISTPTLTQVLTKGNTSTSSIQVGNATVADLFVTSNTININSDTPSNSAPSQDCLLKVERGNAADVAIRWNESSDKWQYTNDGSNYSDIGSGGGDDTTYDLLYAEHSSSSGTGTGNDATIRLRDNNNNDDNIYLVAGTNVTLAHNTSSKQITISSTRGVTVKDEDSALTTTATTLNFKGTGVTASGTGAEKTITINSGGITVKEESTELSTAATTLKFAGTIVTATGSGAEKTITVSTPNLNQVTTGAGANNTSNSITVGDLTCSALNVSSNTITLKSEFAGSNPSDSCYLKVERGNSSDVNIRWNESTDKWQFTNDGSTYYNMLTSGGTSLPAYSSGKYLTNNGSSLSWGDPPNTNYYVSNASWSSSTGQLTLTRSGGVGNLTLGISNLQSYFDTRYSTGGISISGNPTTDSVIRWDGSNWQWSRTLEVKGGISSDNTNLIVHNNTSGYGGMEIDAGGQVLLKKAGTSWREGGHLQFEDESFGNGVQSFAIDVYNDTSNSWDSLIRVIDQTNNMQRFAVNHYGALGIGHTSPPFGNTGQVMISQGEFDPPIWANHSSIAGSSNGQDPKANADIDTLYAQLNAIGEDDLIQTVAQIKERLRALVRS